MCSYMSSHLISRASFNPRDGSRFEFSLSEQRRLRLSEGK